jgi:hypothetical protein
MTPQITDTYHGDFNTIKDNLNMLIVAMNDITAAAEGIANGNLTVTLRERSRQDKLMQALAAMVAGITRVVSDIRGIAGEVASASQAISTTSIEVSKGASSQAASAEEASSSMEEMVSNIKQNADSAQQTDKIANKSAADAQESGRSVVEAVAAMKEIASRVSIIEEIARQTNLLALNAAIEAGQNARRRKLRTRKLRTGSRPGTASGLRRPYDPRSTSCEPSKKPSPNCHRVGRGPAGALFHSAGGGGLKRVQSRFGPAAPAGGTIRTAQDHPEAVRVGVVKPQEESKCARLSSKMTSPAGFCGSRFSQNMANATSRLTAKRRWQRFVPAKKAGNITT